VNPEVIVLSPIPNITRSSNLHLFGYAMDNYGVLMVNITINNNKDYTVSGTNNWSANITLLSGKNLLMIKVFDYARNMNISQYSVILDVIQPVIDVKDPKNNKNIFLTNSNEKCNIEVKGTAWDDTGIEKIEIILDDTIIVNATGTSSWHAMLTFTSGNHKIDARAYDIVGRTNDMIIYIKITPPSTYGYSSLLIIILVIILLMMGLYLKRRYQKGK